MESDKPDTTDSTKDTSLPYKKPKISDFWHQKVSQRFGQELELVLQNATKPVSSAIATGSPRIPRAPRKWLWVEVIRGGLRGGNFTFPLLNWMTSWRWWGVIFRHGPLNCSRRMKLTLQVDLKSSLPTLPKTIYQLRSKDPLISLRVSLFFRRCHPRRFRLWLKMCEDA